MSTFRPAKPILNPNKTPMREGEIEDVKKRAALVLLRAKLATAEPGDKPAIQEELHRATEEATPVITVGRAIVIALTTPIKGDETMSQGVKLTNWKLACAVQDALDANKTVDFDDTQIEAVMKRVNERFPHIGIVAQVQSELTAPAKK